MLTEPRKQGKKKACQSIGFGCKVGNKKEGFDVAG